MREGEEKREPLAEQECGQAGRQAGRQAKSGQSGAELARYSGRGGTEVPISASGSAVKMRASAELAENAGQESDKKGCWLVVRVGALAVWLVGETGQTGAVKLN